MAVSKRLRYEVLRRDNHACRYCGATAPDVRMTVDHVIPETLGGSDSPDNLVTACEPCNSGKSSIQPDAPLVADVRQDELRWSRARETAAAIMAMAIVEADSFVQEFYEGSKAIDAASTRRPNVIAWPDDWEQSIRTFYKYGLPSEAVINAYWRTDVARKVSWYGGWKYFCGICWGKIKELQQMTSDLLAAEED